MILAERWHWQPSEIYGLDLDDLWENADTAREIYAAEAEARKNT